MKKDSNIVESILNSIPDIEKYRETRRRELTIKFVEKLKEKGYTLTSISKKLNSQKSSISRLLSGRNNFNIDKLFDIEYYLGEKILLKEEEQSISSAKIEYIYISFFSESLNKPHSNEIFLTGVTVDNK